MLIDFRVKNFRSFRDEQTFSLVATKDRSLQDSNLLASGTEAAPMLLRSAVIYGANAGGKSNFIKTIQYMRGVVLESASLMHPSQSFNIQTFRLDAASLTIPTEFEVTFMLEGVRHQYGFALTAKRVVSEYLLVYKTSKPQQWFNRYYDPDADQYLYTFSPRLKGAKRIWEEATRHNSLFLSMAVQLNSEQLRPIYNWFLEKLIIFNELSPLSVQHSIEMLQKAEGKKAICRFLKAADISISDIEVIPQKIPEAAFHFDLTTGKTEVREQIQDAYELRFHHTTALGEAIFGLDDESNGTRNLLFLAAPVLEILDNGKILVVDELNNSMHPLLTQRLVEIFQNPILNPHNAQLIFTTHDTSLLDNQLFRRDQIWFVEKGLDQSSTIYPLSDFSPRKNEAFERGYLSGRYGALPFLGEIDEVKNGSRQLT